MRKVHNANVCTSFAPFRTEQQITLECDRLNCLRVTSPGRQNCRHAARENQGRPLPPVRQPDFMQGGPAPQWHPPPNFPHNPLPVEQYPG